MKSTTVLVIMALLLAGIATSAAADKPACTEEGQITICHRQGNAAVTLNVDACGWNGHDGHEKDTIGACQTCGNSLTEGTEQCDAGAQNGAPCTPTYGATCTYCSSTCQNAVVTGPRCGDSITNGQEQCDDGNTINTDACSNTCTFNRNICATETSKIVNEESADWFFWSDQKPAGITAYVIGPAPTPAGTGSARLAAAALADSRALLSTDNLRGTRLRDITTLTYSTFQKPSTQDGVAPALQFDIDTDGTDANTAWQGRLTYEPIYTHTVSEGTWQAWDTLDDAQPGSWWFSGAPGNSTCPQSNPCTWSEILAAYPNAAIRDKGTPYSGLTHLKAGGPSDIDANVDKLVIAVKQQCTTYDFEHKNACGDGTKTTEEACDDGNVADNDGCTSTCTIENGHTCEGSPSTCSATCGDGIKTPSEACDNGQRNGQSCNPSYGQSCNSCSGVCQVVPETGARCGDGVWNTEFEQCDGKDVTPGYSCTAACAKQMIPKPVRPILDCVRNNNDGSYTAFFGYQSDNVEAVSIPVGAENKFTPAPENRNQPTTFQPGRTPYYPNSKFNMTFDGSNQVWYLKSPDGSARTSTASSNGPVCASVCGNGVKEAGEDCDGNDGLIPNYGCSAACTRVYVPYCGDGIVDSNEKCDDGNKESNDGCSSACAIEGGWNCAAQPSVCTSVCGDGIITGAETCDDSNTAAGDGCSATCTTEQGWDCTSTPSACSTTCGDGKIAGAETCDDGNIASDDGCSATCATESCGDGIKQAREACEDHNTADGDGCSKTCTIEETTPLCEQSLFVVSDTTNAVDGHAAAATYAHPAWSASIPGATWIWNSGFVEHPAETEVKIFEKNITIPDAVVKGTLTIAADNKYVVKVNGVTVATSTDGDNYRSETQDTYDVTAPLHSGVNTLTFEVTNDAYNTQDPTVNPAGLLYRLDVIQDTCKGPQPYCGDLVKNGNEQCDGASGVRAGQECTTTCSLHNMCVPETELVANGGFEAPIVTDAQQWGLFASDASGIEWSFQWSAEPHNSPAPVLELQRAVNGWIAHSGQQHAELDSNAPLAIYQDIPTVVGQNYTVSFSFSPRPGTGANDNVLELRIGGATAGQISAPGMESTNWTQHSYEFTATAATTRIELVDLGTANSLGTFVDDVSVMCTPGPLPYCGDGIVNQASEQCDMSAPEGQACTQSCKLVTQVTCEQAVAQGLLRATIDGGAVTVTNAGELPYTVSVASYKMFAATTEDQQLADSKTTTVGAGQTANLAVQNPSCAYQLDVVCGNPKTPPTYGQSVINFTFGSGDYCKPTPSGDVTLSIAPNYPKDGEYVFLCNAEGFTPTKYYWYYGDGQILPNTTQASTYHKYIPGNYTVGCTATDGLQSGTGVLDIEVLSTACQPNVSKRIVSDTSAVVIGGSNAVLAWQPFDSDGNTYWQSHIDHQFTDASWIWQSHRAAAPLSGELWQFKKTFNLNGTPATGRLFVTADNGYEVWINGQYVGGGQVNGNWKNSDFSEEFVHSQGWQTVENYDVAAKLVRGENTILVVAANERMDAADGQAEGTADLNPAGVIFELDVNLTDACREQPAQPVCEQAITISPATSVIAGRNFTVSGTATGNSVIVNSKVVSVLMGAWSVNLTAPALAGNYTVTASTVGDCEVQASAAINVTIVQEQLASVSEQLLFSNGGSRGQCNRGWHKEGDSCVRDPVSRTNDAGSEDNNVFSETPESSPLPDEEPVSREEDSASPKDRRGDLLTGNVTGAGLGASYVWLIILAALIAAGLGGYAYMKWK